MPTFTDEHGKSRFHMNPQMGKKMNSSVESKPSSGEKPMHDSEEESGHELVLSHHGDGSYHTAKPSGEDRMEHPDLGHALTHMAHHMSPAKHVHIHSHEGMHTTHKIHEDGTHEESQDHQSGEEAGHDVSQFLDGENGSEGHQESNAEDLMS